MQILKAIVLATATLSIGTLASVIPHVTPVPALVKRGEIQDITSTIRSHSRSGLSFCSSFLHLPTYAATTNVTVTKTVSATVPVSTVVVTTPVTKTGSAVVLTSTKVNVISVTPTVSSTVVSVVPSSATVATITSVVTGTTTITRTMTSYTNAPLRRQSSSSSSRSSSSSPSIPTWLRGHSSSAISKGCKLVVTPRTKTNTVTATQTVTVKNGTSTAVKTATVVVTPTQTTVITKASTKTVSPAVTSLLTSFSSSLVPLTATDVETTVLTATATATLVLPSPGVTGMIKVVKASDGSTLGYLNEAVSILPIDRAVNFTIPPRSQIDSSTVFNIGITTYTNGFIGAQSDIGDYLQSGSPTFASLGPIPKQPKGPPVQVGNVVSEESQIWSIDFFTGHFSVTYVNPDGNVVPTTIAYITAYGTDPYLCLTGDLAQLTMSFSQGETSEALLLFEPLS